MSTAPPWRLGEAFAHLTAEGTVLPIPVGPDFWTQGVQSLPPGSLVSLMPCGSDWSHWEMHPAGDEFIFQLSGAVTLILEEKAGPHRLSLNTREFAIVPKGIWHTCDIREPGEALFITPGEGTGRRPR